MKLTPEMIRKALRRKRGLGRRVEVNGADDNRVVDVVMFKRRTQWRVVQGVVFDAEDKK